MAAVRPQDLERAHLLAARNTGCASEAKASIEKKFSIDATKKLARGKRVAYQYARVGCGGIKWESGFTGRMANWSWDPTDVSKSLQTHAR
jgi:hypothetical protein